MKRARFIGGIVCSAAAAAIFIVSDTSASVPPAITLMIIGVALVATARR